jgi:hypothetical protein
MGSPGEPRVLAGESWGRLGAPSDLEHARLEETRDEENEGR